MHGGFGHSVMFWRALKRYELYLLARCSVEANANETIMVDTLVVRMMTRRSRNFHYRGPNLKRTIGNFK